MARPKQFATPRIRPATLSDAAALADLGALVFRHTYGAAIPATILDSYLARAFTPTMIRQALTSNATTYLVAEQNERLLGYSKCAATAAPPCVKAKPAVELVNLYVHPAYQGNGVGRQLLHETIQGVTAQAPTILWLCVWQANQRAVDFYQRFGFTIVGKTEVYVDGVVFDDWVMQKEMR